LFFEDYAHGVAAGAADNVSMLVFGEERIMAGFTAEQAVFADAPVLGLDPPEFANP
jgi:hypothetical protein